MKENNGWEQILKEREGRDSNRVCKKNRKCIERSRSSIEKSLVRNEVTSK